MTIGFTTRRMLVTVVALGSIWFALWISIDTIRTILPIISPVPWFDDWSTYDLYLSWINGNINIVTALFAQNNEHRLLFPRLVFFFDDYSFHGQGALELYLTIIVQALHGALLIFMLIRQNKGIIARFAVGGVIWAMMFSLRQSENLSSGFQLQFVMVFYFATLSFYMLSISMERKERQQPIAVPIFFSLVAATVSAFSMANGLLAAVVLSIMSIIGRMRIGVSVICAGWGLALVSIYMSGYQYFGKSDEMSLTPFSVIPMLEYVAAYLGGFIAFQVAPAMVLGCVGILATMVAAWRVVRNRPTSPIDLASFGIMLFCGLTAVMTAYGRYRYGIEQALQSRYATPSAVFWSAQIIYWRINLSNIIDYKSMYRLIINVTIISIAFSIYRNQNPPKVTLYRNYFYQSDAANLLALSLDDPAVIDRVAWSQADVQRLIPLMRQNHISIFSLPAVRAIGKPIEQLGEIPAANTCSGDITAVTPDPSLGQDGVRVYGSANDGARKLRRIFLVDQKRNVIGLASFIKQSRIRSEWQGYAVMPSDTTMTAFAMRDDKTLCSLSR